jgi:hypothetical protein
MGYALTSEAVKFFEEQLLEISTRHDLNSKVQGKMCLDLTGYFKLELGSSVCVQHG